MPTEDLFAALLGAVLCAGSIAFFGSLYMASDGVVHDVGYKQQVCMVNHHEGQSHTVCASGKDLLEWLNKREGK